MIATCRSAVQTHTMILRRCFRRSEGDRVGSRNFILVQCGYRDRLPGGGGLASGQRPSRIGGRSFPASDVPVNGSCVWALPGLHDPAGDGAGARARRATGQSQRTRAGAEQTRSRDASLAVRLSVTDFAPLLRAENKRPTLSAPSGFHPRHAILGPGGSLAPPDL